MADLQKANFGKRIIASILDFILLGILAVGLAALLSWAFGYDGYLNTVQETYTKYEAEYGVEFQLSQQEYEALSQEEKAHLLEAYDALNKDATLTYSYNMLISLTMLILNFSILFGVLMTEFVAPLILKNGQTVGKKIFEIALMHTDGIKVSSVQLFARAVLGKFAIEMMIPLSIIMMLFFNTIGIVGIIILVILLVAQLVCLIRTRTNALIHDIIAGTIAVDIFSQKIFNSREELLEHTKKQHAEKVAHSPYYNN